MKEPEDAAPVLDARDAETLAADIRQRAAGYLPGWQPQPGEVGWALTEIAGRYLRSLNESLNQAPEKNRLAFLDMLGISLLPAQAARAPLVFNPLPQVGHSRVPARTRVAAGDELIFETEKDIALAASALVDCYTTWPGRDEYSNHTAALLAGEPFTLFTDGQPIPHELYLAHDRLLALSGVATVEVRLELERPASLPLDAVWSYWDGEVWRSFKSFVDPAEAEATDSVDGSDRFTRSGTVRLVAECAETAPTTVNGIESYWIRARLSTPLTEAEPPAVQRISLRTIINRPLSGSGCEDELLPDLLFADAIELDPTKAIYPFGQQPRPGSVFYLGSAEVATRKGAELTVCTQVLPTEVDCTTEIDDFAVEDGGDEGTTPSSQPLPPPSVSWEYWNGRKWLALGIAESSSVGTFRSGGTITTTVPLDWEARTINGEEGHWLRARLTAGGYGCRRTLVWTDSAGENTIVVDQVTPPAVAELTLGYAYESPWEAANWVFGQNDFQWTDVTNAAHFRAGTFDAFTPALDRTPTLYLGFDRPLPADLVSLFVDVEEVVGRTRGARLLWETHDGVEWRPLTAVDETDNLALRGTIGLLYTGVRAPVSGEVVLAEGQRVTLPTARQAGRFRPDQLLYIGEGDEGELATSVAVEQNTLLLKAPVSQLYQRVPVAVARLPRFGRPRTWVRARLQSDAEPFPTQLNGLYLNAVWAVQSATYVDETLGSGSGQPHQTVFVRQTPVLPGETIEVRELSGPRAAIELPILEQEVVEHGLSADAVRTVVDPRTGLVSEVWVRWQPRPNFYFSDPADRHYLLERSGGRVLFGDGVNGRLPLVGADNIVARRYQAGGGVAGNVAANTITGLRSGVLAESVFNPIAAEGGADGELIEAVPSRGAATVRHRQQAISLRDYEALAREASPAVAVARALPTTHSTGRAARGWVTVIIMPQSDEARPQPSFGLRQRVQAYLQARVPATVAAGVFVTGPTYLPVGVRATLVSVDLNAAGEVLEAAALALADFFHPLRGGPEGVGWPFGRDVYLSDVAALLEAVAGVDYVPLLNLLLDNVPRGERIDVPADRIVVAGTFDLRLGGG